MKTLRKILSIAFIPSIVFISYPSPLWSIEAMPAISQAHVLEIRGSAEYLKLGSRDWAGLTKEVILKEGDLLKTAAATQVTLELVGNQKTAEVIVREETEFSFAKFTHDKSSDTDNTLLDVKLGSILIKAEKLRGKSKFEVKTPTTVAGIRGTIFEVNVAKEEKTIAT